MSQQVICDLCGNRIERDLIGETTYQVGVISRTNSFLTHEEVHETDYDFCEDCMRKIEDAFDELRANEKGNNDED